MNANDNVVSTNALIEQTAANSQIRFTHDQYRHLVRSCGFPAPLKLFKGLGKGTEGCNPSCAVNILHTACIHFEVGHDWRNAVHLGFMENRKQIFVQSARCTSGLFFDVMNKWYYEDFVRLKRRLKGFSESDDINAHFERMKRFKQRQEKLSYIENKLTEITGIIPERNNAEKVFSKMMEYLKIVKPTLAELIIGDIDRIRQSKGFDNVSSEALQSIYSRIETLMWM